MREWIVNFAVSGYTFLLPIAWIVLAIVVFIVLPMLFWRKTRGVASAALMFSSFLFGATTWFLGAIVTFTSFGWVGLIIGLFVFGLGVVPLGIIGAFFSLGISDLGISLIVMSAITLGARILGAYMADKLESEIQA